MHRFRLVHKNQLNNLNFESYWLVDLKFRAPDWSKFKLFGQIYCRFGRNRNLCSTLVQTTLVLIHFSMNWSKEKVSAKVVILQREMFFFAKKCISFLIKMRKMDRRGNFRTLTTLPISYHHQHTWIHYRDLDLLCKHDMASIPIFFTE